MPKRVAKNHTVEVGNNLSTIAKNYGLTLDKLLAISGNEQFKANPNLIHPGNKVKVSYTVKSGDTLSKIAQNFGTSVQDLVKYNNISDPNHIETGWEVVFSGDSPNFV